MWAWRSWLHLQALPWVDADRPAGSEEDILLNSFRCGRLHNDFWLLLGLCHTCRCYTCCIRTWEKGSVPPIQPPCRSMWPEHKAGPRSRTTHPKGREELSLVQSAGSLNSVLLWQCPRFPALSLRPDSLTNFGLYFWPSSNARTFTDMLCQACQAEETVSSSAFSKRFVYSLLLLLSNGL